MIPEIVEKLKPEITRALCETRDAMLEDLTGKMREIIDVQEEALKKALDQKEAATRDFSAERASYEEDIRRLGQLRA